MQLIIKYDKILNLMILLGAIMQKLNENVNEESNKKLELKEKLMKERNALLAKIPNTKFKAILSKHHLYKRHEVLWDICCASNFSWDDLIAYELYLNAIFSKQGTQEYDFSKILKHTNRHWEMLCARDYPNIKIAHNFRHEYLSQPDVLNKASPLGKQDLTIIRALFDHQPDNMKWQYSIEALTQRVRENHNCLNDAVPEVRNNKTLMLAAINQRAWAFNYVSDNLRNDRNFVLSAVNINAYVLENIGNFNNDREIVLAALGRDGGVLFLISEELRNDREIVLAAVRQNGRALQFASKALRNDREIVLAAVRQKGTALEYASEALRNDREIVLAAVRRYAWALEYASEELRDDREIVLAAVKQDKFALKHASARLRDAINLTNDIIDEVERRPSCNTL